MSKPKITVGRINSTLISPHMAGVPGPSTANEVDKLVKKQLILVNGKLKHDAERLATEIQRLRDCLSVLSSVALANVERSELNVEG